MSIRRAASQLLPARSVHLRVVPRPANLAESREIFRVLARFGDISVFKYLRYEYHSPADNIALAIFRDAASAQQALDASPIRFALDKVIQYPNEHNSQHAQHGSQETDDKDTESLHGPQPLTTTTTGIDEMLRPSDLLNRTEPSSSAQPSPIPNTPPPMPFDPPAPLPHAPLLHTRTKWFQVTVDRSHAVHQDHVERQPFWKQFNPMKTMAQQDLAKQVPHIGLSDVSKRPLNAHRTPNRVLKQMSDYVETVMPSLKGIAEDNANDRSFRERRRIRESPDM